MSYQLNKYSVDDLDVGIINLLLKDAKMSYAEIGKRLHVSSGTIFVRVKKMIDAKLIKGSHIDIDYQMLGYQVQAFVGLRVDGSVSLQSVISQLLDLDSTSMVHSTSGNYQILCHVRTTDLPSLHILIDTMIRSMEGVSYVEIIVTLDHYGGNTIAIENMSS